MRRAISFVVYVRFTHELLVAEAGGLDRTAAVPGPWPPRFIAISLSDQGLVDLSIRSVSD
jgi:hypothetical protein